ncbi:MAG: response regulator transcription factor [Thermoleophilia bacterium]|nr:response regulator transcription factor [Thermoleophilia bacterium]
MRLLLVEDESRVASFIAQGLQDAGYLTDVAGRGGEALARLRGGQVWDLILLDVGLPDMDGFQVLAEIRKADQLTPIIMLTAHGDVPSRVKGLDLGANDYLPKPFDFDELVARIRAQLRQDRQQLASALQAGDLTLDLKARRAVRGDRAVDLTSREFSLLEFFLRHQGQVLSRAQLLNGVWGYDFDPQTNVVDVYVGYLRGKLDTPGQESLIETVRGGGYRFRAPQPPAASD